MSPALAPTLAREAMAVAATVAEEVPVALLGRMQRLDRIGLLHRRTAADAQVGDMLWLDGEWQEVLGCATLGGVFLFRTRPTRLQRSHDFWYDVDPEATMLRLAPKAVR